MDCKVLVKFPLPGARRPTCPVWKQRTEEAATMQQVPTMFTTRIMVSKGTWHKTSTQNLRVFWRFWVLITLTSTLNPICPVLRYPCGKQFFSTEYPSNEIYFPDKKPYSGDFQYKKSHFGKKWPKIDQNCEKKRGFYHYKHSFSSEWSISIKKIPL